MSTEHPDERHFADVREKFAKADLHWIAELEVMQDRVNVMQARLNAIAQYAGHPGNWGASDHRGNLIYDLARGAIDPASRDWSNTNLPTMEDES